jgi:hypothetical protein
VGPALSAPNRVGFGFTGIVIGLAIHRPFINLAFNTPKLRHIVTRPKTPLSN